MAPDYKKWKRGKCEHGLPLAGICSICQKVKSRKYLIKICIMWHDHMPGICLN